MAGFYSLMADAVVAVHAAYVLVVVGLQILVPIGAVRGWKWVRNFTLRAIHLAMIALVVAESLAALACPLTSLEAWLRAQAGRPVAHGSFIGRWAHALLFFDLPTWVFTLGYALFGLAVLATFLLIPPRWPWKNSGKG